MPLYCHTDTSTAVATERVEQPAPSALPRACKAIRLPSVCKGAVPRSRSGTPSSTDGWAEGSLSLSYREKLGLRSYARRLDSPSVSPAGASNVQMAVLGYQSHPRIH